MSKKLPLLIPFLLLSLFALAACTPPLTRGYVYDKQYHPGYTQHVSGYSTTTCTTVKKTKVCKQEKHSGYTVWHSARYYLEITTCSSLETSGQCQTGWVDVDEGTYDSTRIGSYYPEGSGQ